MRLMDECWKGLCKFFSFLAPAAAKLAEPRKPQAVTADAQDAAQPAAVLERAGQGHLLEGLDAEQRQRLLEQVKRLDDSYNGGLEAYVRNARKLLQASKNGENPFEGLTPSVPLGERLTYGDAAFQDFEDRGLREAGFCAFVLVAGGLGERLGFPGIKLKISATSVTGWSFLETYCRGILALERRRTQDAPASPLPLVIMTSDDTHSQTVAALEENGYFGLVREQVHILKQEKVACLSDSDARLARDPKDPSLIETKPHGHGDVHALLHSTGLAKRFHREGRRWVVFFQDTNGLFFRAFLATLGVSAAKGFAMNSVAVPRKPKDAMGGIARLTRPDGSSITMNVEYNQLDPLLRATTNPQGDAADATGFSPFPGNMNSLVLALGDYAATLERTKGIIAEFVNPKYADASRTKFKSSTRLECMMQEIPQELPPSAKVGFTMFDTWCSYSPVKNSPASALDKVKSGNHPQSGTTGETDLYAASCKILRLAGAKVEPPAKRTFNGIDVDLEARVVWSPAWALTFSDVKARLAPGASVEITQRSTLVLDGDIVLENLSLDGALLIYAAPGVRVVVRNLAVMNEGWHLEPCAEDADAEVRLKGFRVRRGACCQLCFEEPGEHVLDEAKPQPRPERRRGVTFNEAELQAQAEAKAGAEAGEEDEDEDEEPRCYRVRSLKSSFGCESEAPLEHFARVRPLTRSFGNTRDFEDAEEDESEARRRLSQYSRVRPLTRSFGNEDDDEELRVRPVRTYGPDDPRSQR